ncbi:MAG: insulinase family protein [Paludibacteraceae bacterium]|nr:insulinase family protein [Paludibacteraceae bacterium]
MAINKFVLKNGLRVVHQEESASPMVVINTLYDVGAKDEDPDHTGFAHLFEHLMFGGSINIPSYDEPIQNAGGEDNAWTCEDFTNYYVMIPASNVEVALWLESDRMLSLNFSQKSLDVQRNVVCEEFKQRNLNQPYGDVSHLVRSMVFKRHPYAWPTIGKELSHIENATLDEVKQFFFSHYAPNNAILSVVGNISFEETKRLVEKWYGDIPRRDVRLRQLPEEPKQTESRRMEVERNVPASMIYKVYHVCGRLEKDYFVSDIISDVLSNGKSSRLYQKLVKERPLFTEVNAYISGDIETGMFYVVGLLAEGTSFEEAEAALEAELKLLCDELVPVSELDKWKNKYEATQVLENMTLLKRANNLAYYELLGDANLMYEEVENYRKVTPQDLQRYAREVFVPENCSTLIYKAKKQ